MIRYPTTARTPTVIDTRAPRISRASSSWPRSLVPRMCWKLWNGGRVHHVGHQVEDDGQGGDQHDNSKDHRVVTVDDRLERELAGAGPAEDALGDDGAVDDLGDGNRDQGDDRKDGVAQRMLVV